MTLKQSAQIIFLASGLGLSQAFATDTAFTEMPYKDTDFSCITPAKAQKYIQDFSIDVESFGGLELCNSTVDSKKLFNDLQILEDGKFSGIVSNNLIRGFIDSNNYYSWMKGETRSINRGNDIPTATAYNSWGNFTMQDGWAQLSTLGRVGTVVHEARHTAGYRHFPCTQGSYEGSNLAGCDRNYDQAGSHAIEMEYYARVSTQGTNFHPVYKSMARLMAMARANFVFNSPILKKREALLAITENSTAELYDNGQWIERELPIQTGHLKRSSAGASLLSGDQAFSIELYGNTQSRPDIRDDYSYFKLNQPGLNYKEFEEFDIGTKRYVAAINDNDQIGFFVFPQGEWGNFQNAQMKVAWTATFLENGDAGFFLVSDLGDIHAYDPVRNTLGSAKGFKWSSDLKSAAKMDGKILSLRADGQIYEMTLNQWVPWSPAANKKFINMVNVPLYDAFEVVR